MRSTVILVLLAAAVAACGDQPPPTSPHASRQTVAPAFSSSAATNAPVSAQGKPTGPVAFTTITRVITNTNVINAGGNKLITASCPAGSTVMSGGYHIVGFSGSASPPWIQISEANLENGWTITVWNTQPGGALVNIYVTAYCAS